MIHKTITSAFARYGQVKEWSPTLWNAAAFGRKAHWSGWLNHDVVYFITVTDEHGKESDCSRLTDALFAFAHRRLDFPAGKGKVEVTLTPGLKGYKELDLRLVRGNVQLNRFYFKGADIIAPALDAFEGRQEPRVFFDWLLDHHQRLQDEVNLL
jgi:hypothetical protein